MNTQIFIDSTIDIPDKWRDEYHIVTVPLHIILEDEVYLDGIDITLSHLHQAMRDGIVPQTSQATPISFYNEFKKALSDGHDVLYLAFSSEMSGTCQAARTAAQDLIKEFPDRRIEIVDSRGGALGVGLIAKKLAEMDREGEDIDALVEEAEKQIDSTNYRFTLTNLDWLVKGGRLGKAAGLIGDLLDIKPILDVEDGEIKVIKKVRGDRKAEKVLIDDLMDGVKDHPDQIYGIGHSNDLKRAEKIKSMIEKKIPGAEVVICEIGSVLTTHLGIGGIGVFWLDENYFS